MTLWANEHTGLDDPNWPAESIPLTPVAPPMKSGAAVETAMSAGPGQTTRRWIKGVMLCTWIVLAVLLANSLLTIIAAAVAYSKEKGQGFGYATLYQGRCSVAKNWTTGIHLLINILSTIILGASNYCLQCLSAPSRSEVDKAHAKRTWLNIGVSSIFDLLVHGRGRRRYLAFTLLATSLPIHLIYNSAVYYSVAPAEYKVVITETSNPIWTTLVTSSHISEGAACVENNVGMSTSMLLATMNADTAIQHMSASECFDHFASDYVYGERALFLMTNESIAGRYPAAYVDIGGRAQGYEGKNVNAYSWMCGHECRYADEAQYTLGDWSIGGIPWLTARFELVVGTSTGPQSLSGDELQPGLYLGDTADTRRLWNLLSQGPSTEDLRADLDNGLLWEDSDWAEHVLIVGREFRCEDHHAVSRNYIIDHCLAILTTEACRLVFSPLICLVVIGCNVIKLTCMFLTARDDRDEIFLTVGDAIASFLRHPDPSTKGACLLSRDEASQGAHGWRRGGDTNKLDYLPGVNRGVPQQLPRRKLYMQAISGKRWFTTLLICASILGASSYLLSKGLADFREYGSGNLWTAGLGGTETSTTLIEDLFRPRTTSNIFGLILLANTPQLLVSIAYFQYNALLTGMLAAAEYNTYGVNCKPLRVSWPTTGSAQRSTYYLSLPYRYSLPLLAASATLHWLISQSFFFVEIITAALDPADIVKVVTCGYSPAAIIFAIMLGSLLVIAVVGMGMRLFPSPMPLAAQCSAAISAACHPLTGEGNHALEPVRWGEEVTVDGGLSGNSSSRDLLGQDGNEMDMPRVFHCSFTSAEVDVPTTGRLYL
ncbi:hypothetical protein BJY01DRAFT_246232 [Aspergillus pseudoustus]|uniref:DUF6536 domain-containing protein n=1 Tax=Aspergillus pseudoustus TaxID=1810923 RepID=A0ABR4K993_9EURO